MLAVACGPDGDIFVLHQPNAQGVTPKTEGLECWLPPLVHIGKDGAFIAAWGGPDHIPAVDGISQWPIGLEGLECDDDGNLWIFGFRTDDHVALKFSPAGELLLRIGQRGRRGADDDTQYLAGPTSCYHDTQTREVFISDGYGNHRVIAFNSDTGTFTRMWGAYGEKPSSEGRTPVDNVYDTKPSAQPPGEGFGLPVHKVARGPQGRLYVADRTKCCVQEFELVPGGARFTREVVVAPGTNVLGTGSAWDVGFSPDGKFMYVADGANFRVWSVDLDSFEILGSTTVHSEYENEENLPLHYSLVHRFAVEANGDLLLACVNRGVRRLKYEGVR